MGFHPFKRGFDLFRFGFLFFFLCLFSFAKSGMELAGCEFLSTLNLRGSKLFGEMGNKWVRMRGIETGRCNDIVDNTAVDTFSD